MFRVNNTTEDETGVCVYLSYTIADGIHLMEMRTANRRNSRLKFCQVAHDFLQFTIDDLYEELQKVRPHFFNNACEPYLNDTTWTAAYWNFLTMRADINAMRNDPQRFANRVHMTIIDNVVPAYNFYNKDSIQTKVTDIKKVSAMILNNLKKLHHETTISVR